MTAWVRSGSRSRSRPMRSAAARAGISCAAQAARRMPGDAAKDVQASTMRPLGFTLSVACLRVLTVERSGAIFT